MKLEKRKELKRKCNGYYKTIIKIINRSLASRYNGQRINIIRNIRNNGPEACVEYYLNKVIPSLHGDYEDLWKIKTNKKFAQAVKNIPLNNVMFARRKGKIQGFEELGKVVNSNDLLDHMITEYPSKFVKLIDKLEGGTVSNGK